tara:strand:- start:452 stop:865 length:414 start_codon:yes stop_codon:yes gene_type:complete
MKENANKYLDNLSKKVIKKAKIESPSFNFTNAVMSQVNALSPSKTLVYKPLISKTVWLLISISFLAIVGYVIFKEGLNSSSWFNTIDYSIISNNKLINTLLGLSIPKIVTYALVLFGIMFSIQIPFLKHYFDKQLEA